MSQANRYRLLLTLVTIVASGSIAVGSARAQSDHLRCFKVKDQAKFDAQATLTALQAQFGIAEECSIKGKAKLFCVPVSKQVTGFLDKSKAGIPQFPFAGPDLENDAICYKAKCPKRELDPEQVTDQFGTRTVEKFKSQLVCTPAVKGTPGTTGGDPTGVFDHRRCFKVKDEAKFIAEASLNASQPQFGVNEACSIKGKAKLFCAPVSKQVTEFLDKSKDGIPQVQFVGQDLQNDAICYKTKCPKRELAPEVVTDQFGTRTVEKFKSQLLCAPAVKGVPSTTMCVPDCAGKNCGDDGCGGSCGTCTPPDTCVNGTCTCTPDCTGKNCGDDGCGGNCGTCTPPDTCVNGTCTTCTPDCTGKNCGDDGCGGSCGTCTPPDTCVNGTCTCTPDCTGKNCGDDGCGGSCGTCTPPDTCANGTCVPPGGCVATSGTYCDTGLTVIDSATGLEWVKLVSSTSCDNLTDCDGQCTGALCVGNRYTWSDGGQAADGSVFDRHLRQLNGELAAFLPTQGGGTTAFERTCYADYCDWRLSESDELEAILLGSCTSAPCIDSIFGPTISSLYWSSTTDPSNALAALGGDFNSGTVVGSTKTNFHHVRAVRGAGPPACEDAGAPTCAGTCPGVGGTCFFDQILEECACTASECEPGSFGNGCVGGCGLSTGSCGCDGGGTCVSGGCNDSGDCAPGQDCITVPIFPTKACVGGACVFNEQCGSGGFCNCSLLFCSCQ